MATFINLLTSQLIVPFLFIVWLWGSQTPSRVNWLLQVLATAAVVVFSLAVGAQAWTSVYLGGLLLILFITVFIKSLFNLPENWTPFQFGDNWKEKIFTGSNFLVCVIFLPLSMYALTGYSVPSESIDLRFPLKNGVYHVGHGGTNPLINYHNTSTSQRYALDISRLNIFGTRSRGIYPKQLEAYAVYGDTIYNPCDGSVQKIVSDQPDYIPPNRDQENPAGNHVILKCKETLIYLAHMMQNSAVIDSGMVIKQGMPIGRVGNSGNTTEPHLHIHAIRNGNGIPITFNNRFLVRNSLIWR